MGHSRWTRRTGLVPRLCYGNIKWSPFKRIEKKLTYKDYHSGSTSDAANIHAYRNINKHSNRIYESETLHSKMTWTTAICTKT